MIMDYEDHLILIIELNKDTIDNIMVQVKKQDEASCKENHLIGL